MGLRYGRCRKPQGEGCRGCGARVTSIPGGVVHGHKHPRMADGENVNLVTDKFIYDAVRFANDLAEPVGINRNDVEALHGNAWPREREVAYVGCRCAQLAFPSQGVVNGESLSNSEDDIIKKSLGVWRPKNDYIAVSLDDRIERSFLWSRSKTVSFGIPLPSANSRREISTSRESSMRSKRLSSDSASTRYEAACPFCVMRTGRWVSRTRVMYMERLLRHSENGTTSSLGRQRRIVRSRTFGMAIPPSVSASCIVQNFGVTVNGGIERCRVEVRCAGGRVVVYFAAI